MSLSVTSKQIFKLKMCSVFTRGSGKCLSFYCVPRHCSWREKCDSNSLHTLSMLWEKRNEWKISTQGVVRRPRLWVARESCLRKQHRHLLRIARLTAAGRRSQWAGSLPVDTKIREPTVGRMDTGPPTLERGDLYIINSQTRWPHQPWKHVQVLLSRQWYLWWVLRGSTSSSLCLNSTSRAAAWPDLTLGGEGREGPGEQPRGPPRPWLFTNSFTFLWLQLLSISLFEFW